MLGIPDSPLPDITIDLMFQGIYTELFEWQYHQIYASLDFSMIVKHKHSLHIYLYPYIFFLLNLL